MGNGLKVFKHLISVVTMDLEINSELVKAWYGNSIDHLEAEKLVVKDRIIVKIGNTVIDIGKGKSGKGNDKAMVDIYPFEKGKEWEWYLNTGYEVSQKARGFGKGKVETD